MDGMNGLNKIGMVAGYMYDREFCQNRECYLSLTISTIMYISPPAERQTPKSKVGVVAITESPLLEHGTTTDGSMAALNRGSVLKRT